MAHRIPPRPTMVEARVTDPTPPDFQRIAMPDADVRLLAHAPMPLPEDAIFARLRDETDWLFQQVFVWGKWHDQPRGTAWHGDPGRSYTYSGRTMDPRPWTPLLAMLKRQVEHLAGTNFNSVLLNLYRDQHDRMGFHADNEASLGPEPTIASLSFGATRLLKFRHRSRRELGVVKVPLGDASLLVMRGPTQAHWLHGIDRTRQPCGPRINLTFRHILE